MEQPTQIPQSPRRGVVLGGCLAFVLAAGLAWTFTPSYALYHIRRALETHDYERFAHYVDVDRVVGAALDELGLSSPLDEASDEDSLADIFRQGLQALGTEVRGLVSAGVGFMIKQAVQDQSRQLPAIPTVAILGAIFAGEAQDSTRRFSVHLQNGQQIGVRMQKSAQGVWRVVAVTNIKGLLAQLKERWLDGQAVE